MKLTTEESKKDEVKPMGMKLTTKETTIGCRLRNQHLQPKGLKMANSLTNQR